MAECRQIGRLQKHEGVHEFVKVLEVLQLLDATLCHRSKTEGIYEYVINARSSLHLVFTYLLILLISVLCIFLQNVIDG